MVAKKKRSSKGKVVGEVVMKPVAMVKPNEWNPNEMDKAQMESMAHGFREDGWLKSQSLLVWGKDDKGVEQNIIIDGEHRWYTAKAVGITEGPMVILDGLTESEAKALTIKMDSKRGEFNRDKLALVVAELQGELSVEDLGLELGIGDEELMSMLSVDPDEVEGAGSAAPGEGTTPPDRTINHTPPGDTTGMGHIRLVQLFFTEEQNEEFNEWMKALGEQFETKNVTDTVFQAVKSAAEGSAS